MRMPQGEVDPVVSNDHVLDLRESFVERFDDSSFDFVATDRDRPFHEAPSKLGMSVLVRAPNEPTMRSPRRTSRVISTDAAARPAAMSLSATGRSRKGSWAS